MNDATLRFHCQNINRRNRINGHVKAINLEIGHLRLFAYKFHGTYPARFASQQANYYEKMLGLAMRGQYK